MSLSHTFCLSCFSAVCYFRCLTLTHCGFHHFRYTTASHCGLGIVRGVSLLFIGITLCGSRGLTSSHLSSSVLYNLSHICSLGLVCVIRLFHCYSLSWLCVDSCALLLLIAVTLHVLSVHCCSLEWILVISGVSLLLTWVILFHTGVPLPLTGCFYIFSDVPLPLLGVGFFLARNNTDFTGVAMLFLQVSHFHSLS